MVENLEVIDFAAVLAALEKVEFLFRREVLGLVAALAAVLRHRRASLAVRAFRNQRGVVVGNGNARVRISGQSR